MLVSEAALERVRDFARDDANGNEIYRGQARIAKLLLKIEAELEAEYEVEMARQGGLREMFG